MTPAPGKIFINYRRDDDPSSAARIYDRLEIEFGAEQLFMDVEGHIKGGDDFVEVLQAQVAQCDVLLAVIGPRWLEVKDEQGRNRLNNPEDWVRVEIVGALETKSSQRVIPVLVGNADMPRSADLPDVLKPLTRRQAIRVTLERFKADVQGLVEQIKSALGEVERARESEAERKAAEIERQRRETEAERVEARAQAQRDAGLSLEEVRKAEELANWSFVQGRNDIMDLRDHLARFPNGTTQRYALAKLDGLLWTGLGGTPTLDQLRDYLDEFPRGEHVTEAQARIATLEKEAAEARAAEERRARETKAWGAVAVSTDKAAIEVFLKEWPAGQHSAAAQARLKELKGGRFTRRGLLQAFGGGALATGVVGGGLYAIREARSTGTPLWRLLNDQSVRTFDSGWEWLFMSISVTFAPDGRVALTAFDGKLMLWDVLTGNRLAEIARKGSGSYWILSIAFAPNGGTVLAACSDNKLRLWDVATGQLIREFIEQTGPVHCVAFLPDGRTALSGSFQGRLNLWDVATGKNLRTFWPEGQVGDVKCIAIAPDGRTALSGDLQIRLWDMNTGRQLRIIASQENSFFSMAFAPDGRTALIAGVQYGNEHSSLPKLWDVATGKELLTFQVSGGGYLSAALAPDGRTALFRGKDNKLELWDVETNRVLRNLTGHTSTIRSVVFSPDGRTALSGSNDGKAKLWDVTR